MKILQINTVYNKGSTGKIVKQIQEMSEKNGHVCVGAHRYKEIGDKNQQGQAIDVSSWLDCHIHNRLARITGLQGMFSCMKTVVFLKKISRFNPDIIHLHNIHGSYINHHLLFKYIKGKNIPVIWTLHDCWAFTGGCPHFSYENCDKWKAGCRDCAKQDTGLRRLFGNSRRMYRFKKKTFTGIDNMTIVTPSKWLANLVDESFLKSYPVRVIYNGIDLSVFKPTKESVYEKYGIDSSRKIILGVSYIWNTKKGLDVFVDLSKQLSDEYQIVLVGTNEEVEKELPSNITSIRRTNEQKELAAIYSIADVFVNPTREEVFGMVNIEALACGTPVVVFDVGGCAECLDEKSGVTLECNDIVSLKNSIIRICTEKPYSHQNCRERAMKFSMDHKIREYLDLYEELGEELTSGIKS